MPRGKLRGAAREYLQVMILKGLYAARGSRDLLFLGGTALRCGYNIPRFSEDLDFDAKGVTGREWAGILAEAAHLLSALGLEPELRTREKGKLLSGEIRFRGFLQYYGIASARDEKLMIKLEANRPVWRLSAEPRVISGYGEMFPAVFASPGLLFAEKIGALLERRQGRDIFDVFFMAGLKWRPDTAVLKARGAGVDPAGSVIRRVGSWDGRELVRMSRSLEPFLFEPAGATLVARAHSLLPGILEYLSAKPSTPGRSK